MPDSLLSVDVVARLRSQPADPRDRLVRLLSGERLVQYNEDIAPLTPDVVSPYGDYALLFDGFRSSDGIHDLLKSAATFEVELAGDLRGNQDHARWVLNALFSGEEPDAILALTQREPDAWHAHRIPAIPPALAGCGAFSLRTVHINRDGAHCLLDLYILVHPSWLVALWNGPFDCQTRIPQRYSHRVLPGSRVSSGLTSVAGDGGEERLCRLVQVLLRHHEFSSEVLGACLASWESHFFEAVDGNPTRTSGERFRDLQKELSNLRSFLTNLDDAQRSLRRRAQNQPAFPSAVRDEAISRCDDLADEIRTQRRDIQSEYALLTGAANEEQARVAQDREDRVRRLTVLATVVGGIVLWPSLVASYYSANVKGLPGLGTRQGFHLMLGLSIGGALATIGALLAALFIRRRTK